MRARLLAPVGVVLGHVTVATAVAAVAVGRAGIGLVAPTVGAPARIATTVSRGARDLWDSELSGELASLLDPRRGRSRRRVADHLDRVHAEVRGLTGPDGARLGAVLEKRLAEVPGLPWWQVNAVTGRVSVGLDTGQRTVGDVLEIIRSAEAECGTRDVPWNRHVDLPGDREPLIAAGLAVVANLVGAAVAVASRAVPAPAAGPLLAATVALVDAQPRLRRIVEAQLGAARTDLAITAGNAAAQAMSHGGATLLVDAGQRVAWFVELLAARASWQRWDRALHGPGGIAITDPLHSDERPHPLPPGPIERFADQAAAGSLLAAAASLMGHQNVAETAEVLLVGVPKATRTSRASFASVLSASLSRQGALCLDSSVWRRLDRVSALVVDGAALRTGRPLVLDAQLLDDAWSTAHVWGAGQRLLREHFAGAQGGDPSPLPIPPPRGRVRDRLQLDEYHPGSHDPDGVPRGGSGARWRDLSDDGRVVGRVLVGRELHPRADSLLATARRSGLRVVLAGEAPGSELRGRADEVIPPGGSLTGAVRRLQQSGHAVAVLSTHGHRALAAADVGLGMPVRTHAGRLHIPWSADVICEDLAGIEQIVAATTRARAVSERGRTMSMSASALGALLLIAGPRPGAWHRAISPVTGAALIGLITGAHNGWLAGRPLPGPSAPLVPWHCLEADEVLSRLPIPPERTEHGPGRAARAGDALRVPLRSAASMITYVRHELDDPLTPVLTVGAGASAILGAPTDAALVGCVMGVNAVISALQRRRADGAMRTMHQNERVLARCLTGPRARSIDAVPDGTTGDHLPSWTLSAAAIEGLTPADQLRPGDVVALGPGDVVPADARLLRTDGLEVDESGLTGESVTVEKRVGATPGAALGERACMVFEGSIVVTGRARAVVVAVGPDTQAGRAVAAIPRGSGSGGVQAQLRALTDKALPLTLAGGALVSGLGMLRGQRMRAAVADGVAVAVAAVPEGLPLVATVAQLAAARRLSRRGVLVRSSRTIEALGRVDTMCFDKTGTLTHGVLRLVELADLTGSWTPGQAAQSRDARRLLRAAARACPDPRDGPVVHATDRAVLDAAGEHHLENTHVWDLMEEVPFESNRGYAAALGRSRQAMRLVVKGAPEVLLPHCAHVLRAADSDRERDAMELSERDREIALNVVNSLAAKGLRVLLVAAREFTDTPEDLEAAVDNLTLLGFIGLADTPRASTLPVIRELTANGISARMITGDHPVTARAIAAQLGIGHEHVVTGAELDALDETARTTLINRATVFARLTPENKVRIIEALQRTGKVVAMTGDGSNDAAAIRRADVGIGLTALGSAAARNAADLVLTEPDLTLLLDALVEGRMMWQRVRDAVAVLVGGNAGEVAFTIFGTALAGRAPLGTRQFLLVNLLTDMFPAMAVAVAHPRPSFAPTADADTGAEGDQRAEQLGAELATLPKPELGGTLLRSIAIRGTATACGASTAWLIGRASGTPRRAATMGLVALVGTQLGQTLLLGGRSPLVWVTVVGSGAVLVGVVQTPGVSQFFGCTPLDPAAYLAVAASATAATVGSVLVPRLLPVAVAACGGVLHRRDSR